MTEEIIKQLEILNDRLLDIKILMIAKMLVEHDDYSVVDALEYAGDYQVHME